MNNSEQEPVADEEDGDQTGGHGPWRVTLGPNQEVIGLPEWVDPKNVILRLINFGPDVEPGWEAVNPTEKDKEERDKWQGNMQPRK